MSKRLILILGLVLGLGLIASAVYAEVQDIKVSGDILLRGISRQAFTLDDTSVWECSAPSTKNRESFVLSTVRVRLDADLTDNVAATVRLLNERVWGDTLSTGSSSENDDEVLMDLAYITLKEFLYSPLTLIAGRQEMRFGNALIIGDPDTNIAAYTWTGNLPSTYTMPATDLSARKSFDALRATFDYSPLTVDLIYSIIDENYTVQNDDITLLGANFAYDIGINNTLAEAYFFEKKRDTLTAGAKDNETCTIGGRIQTEPIENLVLNAEVAHQFGEYSYESTVFPNDSARSTSDSANRDAWAVQLGADYLFADVKYEPSIGLWYTYLSGEKDGRATGDYTGWDSMFEDQDGGTIYNAIIAATNYHLINLKGSLKPMEDVTATLCYSHITLDRKLTNNATFTLNGLNNGVTYLMTDKKELGDEIDLILTYDYTEDVQLGLNAGVFIPGNAFDSANDRTATQVIGSMKVIF